MFYVHNTVHDDTIKKIYKLACEIYGSDVANPPTLLKSWHSRNENIFWVALNEHNEVVGYITALPLTEEAFNSTLRTDFDQHKLTSDQIKPYKEPGNYQIYFTSIVVRPDYRKKQPSLSRLLRNEFLKSLVSMGDRGIHVTDLSAQVITVMGGHAMRTLGLDYVQDGEHGKVYHGKVDASLLKSLIRDPIKSKL
jgi:hypothetical protein